jgi:hypothetical protein
LSPISNAPLPSSSDVSDSGGLGGLRPLSYHVSVHGANSPRAGKWKRMIDSLGGWSAVAPVVCTTSTEVGGPSFSDQ